MTCSSTSPVLSATSPSLPRAFPQRKERRHEHHQDRRRFEGHPGAGQHRLGLRAPPRARHPPGRGRRGHQGLRRRPHSGGRGLQLGNAAPGPAAPRHHRPGRFRSPARGRGHLEPGHGRAVRGQQQLVRRLRVLAVQALRPR